MRFKRISTDTVRCIVSQDELMENGLDMDDFMSNSGRTEEFLRKMLSQAEQEVGFRVQGGPLTIQVAALPENKLALTFSEKQAGSNFMELLEGLRSAMSNLSDAVNEKAKDQPDDTDDKENAGQAEQEAYLLEFHGMEDLGAFCRNVSPGIEEELGLDSSLYYLEDDGIYGLVLQKGGMDIKQLCRVVSASMEFLEAASANEMQIAYIREHGKCMLKERAITQLQKLFRH